MNNQTVEVQYDTTSPTVSLALSDSTRLRNIGDVSYSYQDDISVNGLSIKLTFDDSGSTIDFSNNYADAFDVADITLNNLDLSGSITWSSLTEATIIVKPIQDGTCSIVVPADSFKDEAGNRKYFIKHNFLHA